MRMKGAAGCVDTGMERQGEEAPGVRQWLGCLGLQWVVMGLAGGTVLDGTENERAATPFQKG